MPNYRDYIVCTTIVDRIIVVGPLDFRKLVIEQLKEDNFLVTHDGPHAPTRFKIMAERTLGSNPPGVTDTRRAAAQEAEVIET